MGRRIWEFPRQNEVSNTTLFLCADGEQTVAVPGGIISDMDARIDTIIAGSSSGKDSELVDMRTLDSAHNYASAGAALRQVWQGLTQGSVATYTAEDFMGDVSDGTVTVFEKAGWCLVRGSVVLSSAASNWATVLSSSAVPAPQHGDSLRQVCPYWGTSYTRPTIVSIGSSGGLLLRYGAAGSTAYFHFCYPVD